VDGRFVPTPWRVRCDAHCVFDGMTIPVRCQVQWERAGRAEPYWRGRITSARYDVAR
jgi:hypothetical protein